MRFQPEELSPGLYHLPGCLSLDEQIRLASRCLELGRGGVGLYTPTVRGGAKMRLEMLCLGRHWNPLTYRYESTRSDYDGRPVPPLPDDFRSLARQVAASVGFDFEPDICIMNLYRDDGRLGLHQDKDERAETIAAGIPIVSLSLGHTARFIVGGTRRKDAVRPVLLQSGDGFVMGGPSRLRYHGVNRVLAGTAPLALEIDCRLNLTFRQY